MELSEREERIERAQRNAFFETGLELRAIRDGRLYEEEFGTFEEYYAERWEWNRTRAYHLIDAASVTEKMSTIVDITPTRESHVRPLLTLESDDGRHKKPGEKWGNSPG